MEAIALVAVCFVAFLIAIWTLSALCRTALRSNRDLEGGFKIMSVTFWLRVTSGTGSPEVLQGQRPSTERTRSVRRSWRAADIFRSRHGQAKSSAPEADELSGQASGAADK
jgi:hypothetical protein